MGLRYSEGKWRPSASLRIRDIEPSCGARGVSCPTDQGRNATLFWLDSHDGNPLAASEQAAGQQGELVTFGYNAVGQLASVTSDDGTQFVASTTYNAQGQATEQRVDAGANGFTRQSVYNPNTLRLETLKAGTAAPFENLQKLAYAYDLADNIPTLTTAATDGETQTFGYDWLGQPSADGASMRCAAPLCAGNGALVEPTYNE